MKKHIFYRVSNCGDKLVFKTRKEAFDWIREILEDNETIEIKQIRMTEDEYNQLQEM